MLDLAESGIDVAIRGSSGHCRGMEVRLISRSVVLPVAAPADIDQ